MNIAYRSASGFQKLDAQTYSIPFLPVIPSKATAANALFKLDASDV